MKKLFCFLGMFVAFCSANAATMCVPDLSACESCRDFSYSDAFWTANCCGVFVKGMYFITQGIAPSVKSAPVERLFPTGTALGASAEYDVCFMVYPFISEYATIASCGGVYLFSADVSRCASFSPKCALTYCSESSGCKNPYK